MPILRALFFALLTRVLSPIAFAQATPLHGIEVNDLDRKTDRCNDFYDFANGTWRAHNPIPASMTRWSRRWAAGESSKDRLKEILEEAATDKNTARGSPEQIIGDYYGACMDESRVNAGGIEPLKPWFARIDSAKDMPELQRIMADMHDILVTDPFAFGGQQDPHKPSWVLADIGASGLALPAIRSLGFGHSELTPVGIMETGFGTSHKPFSPRASYREPRFAGPSMSAFAC